MSMGNWEKQMETMKEKKDKDKSPMGKEKTL